MKFCAYCGAKLEDEAAFCAVCGQSCDAPDTAPRTQAAPQYTAAPQNQAAPQTQAAQQYTAAPQTQAAQQYTAMPQYTPAQTYAAQSAGKKPSSGKKAAIIAVIIVVIIAAAAAVFLLTRGKKDAADTETQTGAAASGTADEKDAHGGQSGGKDDGQAAPSSSGVFDWQTGTGTAQTGTGTAQTGTGTAQGNTDAQGSTEPEKPEPEKPEPEPAKPAPQIPEEEANRLYAGLISSKADTHRAAGRGFGGEMRALLYDYNGDGFKELLLIRIDEGKALAEGFVYTLTDSGETEEIESWSVPMAGGGRAAFYEVTYENEKYLAFSGGNYDGGKEHDEFYLIKESGGGAVTAHILSVFTLDSERNAVTHVSVDGAERTGINSDALFEKPLIAAYKDMGYSGSEFMSRYIGARQVLEVVCSGSEAEMTLYEDTAGGRKELCSAHAYIGSNGISASKREGDKCTPAGTFDILYYVSAERLDSGLQYVDIPEDGDTWVCSSSSPYYNTLQPENRLSSADLRGSEDMVKKFADGKSVACIVFDFNGDGLAYGGATAERGSDLFIDGVGASGNLRSGYGDIKITAADMYELLSHLDAEKFPVVVIK